MYLDGKLIETANLPASFAVRRPELFWKYQLPEAKHTVSFKWLNPNENSSIYLSEILVYTGSSPNIK